MGPHLEEAWRALRLADRDITAFRLLRQEPAAHVSIVCFHAQQAVEKSLKTILFSRQIEFERTHDLVRLAHLIKDQSILPPVPDDQLRQLNPFVVTYRYDDLEYELVSQTI